MNIARHIVQPLIIILFCGGFAAIARMKGEKRSRYFAYAIGCAGLVFLILGFVALVTREYEHITGRAVFGILLMLFGVTCLFQTHTHLEIAKLRRELDSRKNQMGPNGV
jgi:hypothetical protein